MKVLLALLPLCLASACSGDDGGMLPPTDTGEEKETRFGKPDGEDSDATASGPCSSLWNLSLPTGGASTHPALGKGGVVYVAASEALYAVSTDGKLMWAWPADDTEGKVPPVEAQLYTPVIGKEGVLYMGTGLQKLLAINKNGSGRFTIDLDGDVTGAPALPKGGKDQLIVAMTDSGALYTVKDLGQNKPWILAGRSGEKAVKDPVPGIQPIIGPWTQDGASETAFVLARSALHCFRVTDLEPLWSYPMPEGLVATSNMVMDDEGHVLFGSGGTPVGGEYQTHYVLSVTASGELVDGFPATVDLLGKVTTIVTLSQGIKDRILLGTTTAGLILYDVGSMYLYKTVTGQDQNITDVAQPIQSDDGHVYFGAFPSFVYALTEQAEVLWYKDLDELDPSIGAQLRPSSPLILSDGTVIFHAGYFLVAAHCTDSGPANVAWPRFGGNDQNTGNYSDPE
jgi:outer membrane protein assembly factor BamB